MDEVAAAVSLLLGEPCESLRAIDAGWSSSSTYAARVADRDVVVKLNADVSKLAWTAHNLAVLGGLGVPVPRLLAYDDSGVLLPGAIVVMEQIGGVDLRDAIDGMSPAQLTRLAGRIVDMQRRVATLPAPAGCGYVGIGEPATRTWSDVVHRPNGCIYADPLPADSAHLVPTLQAALQKAEPYFQRVRPTAFLDDVTTKNVMIENGELAGVVDFDVICYGDPLFHLGLTAAAVTANAERPESRFYVEELLRLSDTAGAQRRIVAVYEALFLVSFLVAESPTTPGAWRRRAIDGAERALVSAQG